MHTLLMLHFLTISRSLPLQVAIRALGFEVKKADVLKILRDYDRDGSGKITFRDFSEVSKSTAPLCSDTCSLQKKLVNHNFNWVKKITLKRLQQ